MNGGSIRLAEPSDREQLARLRRALWPESPVEEHARELSAIFAGTFWGTLPLVDFVAEAADGTLIGFLEVGLRSHADHCNPTHPVGYVEGWYVAENFRRQGNGSALLRAAEDWARMRGAPKWPRILSSIIRCPKTLIGRSDLRRSSAASSSASRCEI